MRGVIHRLLTSWLLLAMVACTASPPQREGYVDLPRSVQAGQLFVEIAMDRQGTVYLNNRRLGADWEEPIGRAIRATMMYVYLSGREWRQVVSIEPYVPMISFRFDRGLTFDRINRVLTVCARHHAHSVGLITVPSNRNILSGVNSLPARFFGLPVHILSAVEIFGPDAPGHYFNPICLAIESAERVRINSSGMPVSELTDWAAKLWTQRRDPRLYIITREDIHYETLISILSRVRAGADVDLQLVLSADVKYFKIWLEPKPVPPARLPATKE